MLRKGSSEDFPLRVPPSSSVGKLLPSLYYLLQVLLLPLPQSHLVNRTMQMGNMGAWKGEVESRQPLDRWLADIYSLIF